MTNFIPYESKIFNDREPPWIDNKVKTIVKEKNKIYQLYFKNKSNMLATKLETVQNVIYDPGELQKQVLRKHLKKLCSKVMTPKYYWSLLKTTLNYKQNSLHLAYYSR